MSKVTKYEFDAEKRPETKSDLVIYSYKHCPYAQKARLALLEKEVDFDEVEIKLDVPRPQWYLDINPRGLVPAIVHKGNIIIESAICAEYVDEEFNHNHPLLPKDNYLRSVARLYIATVGDIAGKFFQYLKESDETQLDEKKKELDKIFREIENGIEKYRQDDGPYFFGSQFSLVDIHILPFLERLVVLERFKGYSLPTEFKNLNRLKEAGFARKSFQETVSDPEILVTLYKKFLTK